MTNNFSFKVAFLNYGGFWSSLRLCPGIKYVEAAKDEIKLIENGYYVFRVVTDPKGIKIPAFQYDIFKPLIDNGWSYDRDITHCNDRVDIICHFLSKTHLLGMGETYFNKCKINLFQKQ